MTKISYKSKISQTVSKEEYKSKKINRGGGKMPLKEGVQLFLITQRNV